MGLAPRGLITQGLRPGLHFFAASRLVGQEFPTHTVLGQAGMHFRYLHFASYFMA